VRLRTWLIVVAGVGVAASAAAGTLLWLVVTRPVEIAMALAAR
jgi:hypothetical protein